MILSSCLTDILTTFRNFLYCSLDLISIDYCSKYSFLSNKLLIEALDNEVFSSNSSNNALIIFCFRRNTFQDIANGTLQLSSF